MNGDEFIRMKNLTIVFILWLLLIGPSLADDKSGPGRTTLKTFDGGTIYAVNGKVTRQKSNLGDITLETAEGEVVVKTTPWGYDIVGPQGTIKSVPA